jgi:ribonucleoside-diphosphate reductase alpha chain
LWLRSNGSLELAVKQLEGIGSSLSVPTREGRIMSLPDGLAKAIHRYLEAKKQHGLEALLLGRANLEAAPNSNGTSASSPKQPRNVASYKIKCPSCEGDLAFMEGCAKCHSCGFSQC